MYEERQVRYELCSFNVSNRVTCTLLCVCRACYYSRSMYMYIYVHIHVYIHDYIYMYIYIGGIK